MTAESSLSIETLAHFMNPIPCGSINLRDDRLKRHWEVSIQAFSCCAVPVTQGFYAEVIRGSIFSEVESNHPVHSVSWLEAAQFCNLLSARFDLPNRYQFSASGDDAVIVSESVGFRLPTEAEWEFACHAGTAGPRYAPLDEIAWYKNNSEGHAQPVALKQPNQWGIFDMLGNVWEWCEDVYDPTVYGTYRTFRGGGWADGERGCLATNRRRSHPTFAIDDLGFRIVRSTF